ncbi:MAG: hypothetical protein H7833_10640 [Magnetococcus sp. DMHC-1]|nr:hypothetical protein [Magnetococcales bacterium]
MSRHVMQNLLYEEIQQIPDSGLSALYNIVHLFRLSALSVNQESKINTDIENEKAIQAINAFRGSGQGRGTERLLKDRQLDHEKEM